MFDPSSMPKAKEILGKKVIFCKDSYSACRDSECLLIITEWEEFQKPDFLKVKKLLKRPLIIDGRNIYDPKKLKNLGFTYIGMGIVRDA